MATLSESQQLAWLADDRHMAPLDPEVQLAAGDCMYGSITQALACLGGERIHTADLNRAMADELRGTVVKALRTVLPLLPRDQQRSLVDVPFWPQLDRDPAGVLAQMSNRHVWAGSAELAMVCLVLNVIVRVWENTTKNTMSGYVFTPRMLITQGVVNEEQAHQIRAEAESQGVATMTYVRLSQCADRVPNGVAVPIWHVPGHYRPLYYLPDD